MVISLPYRVRDDRASSFGELGKDRRASGNTGSPQRDIRDSPKRRRPVMTKIALVTGSSRGLGRNTALAIARKGGDVIVTYHSRSGDADKVVAEIQAMGRKAVALQLDTGNVAGFADFATRLKDVLGTTWRRNTLDHLVNNAGHGDYALIADTSEAQFDALINVHFKGVFFLTQTLLPLIADGGRIVNLSSGLTRFCAPGFGAYAAAKGAIEVLSLYLAKELGNRGIAVNTVAPGAIETDFLGGAVRDTPDMNQQFADMTALGRVGVPDDIGPMIASLLGEDNRWVNAQRIEVSGGQAI
ncbi:MULTISPECIES: SDR family oxidoreductase [Sphingobium]|nr:SDR family oxidoreductase [Sphingobium xenophagum]